MTYPVNDTPTPTATLLSQTVFVLTAVAIILAGSWSLYMNDAPYHPVEDAALHIKQ